MTEEQASGPASAVNWDEERSRRWVRDAGTRERQLEPVLDWIIEAAELQPGEVVLDVGCGTGPTTARAAAAVTRSGSVTGVDVSEIMLDAARQRVVEPQIRWVCADAATHPFPAGSFDAVISRFGVMFFADPGAAFANLAAATRPGGRLVLAVWRPRPETPFFEVPFRWVADTLDRLGAAYPQSDPQQSAFAFGQADRVEPLLAAAGWGEVTCTPCDEPLYLGGHGDVESIVDVAIDHGPVRELVAGQPADVLAAVRDDLRTLIAAGHDGTGFPLPAGVLIVGARRTGA